MSDKQEKKKHTVVSRCDDCMHFTYDYEYECWDCGMSMNMDEDDYMRITTDSHSYCPYYRPGNEYTIVRKQN
jgi:uncharacterized OB-fold protein